MDWWKTDGKQMMVDLRKRAEEFGQALVTLDGEFRKMSGGVSLVTFAMTLLSFAIGLVVGGQLIKWLKSSYSSVVDLAKGVGKAATAIGKMAAETLGFSKALDTEAVAAEGAEAASAPFLIWGLIIVAVLALIAAAIYLLIVDFMAWRKGANSVIAEIGKRFPETFALIGGMILLLKDEFTELWDSIKALWKVVGPSIKEFLKWMLLIAVVVLGLVIGAILLLAYLAVYAFVKMLTWAVEFQTWLATLIPVDEIKAKWKETTDYFTGLLDTWRAAWRDANADIKAQSNQTMDALHMGHEWLKGQWADLCTHFTTDWQKAADSIKSIWTKLMGWLDPMLKGIGIAFQLATGNVAGAAASAANWTAGAMPAAPTLAAAGGGIAPATPPSMFYSNPRSQSVTHNNDVKATFNIQTTDPVLAGNTAADKLDTLTQVATRYATPGSY